MVATGYLLFQEHKIVRASGENLLPAKFYQFHSYISLILFTGLLSDRIFYLAILDSKAYLK
ncbi:dimethylallyltranstransferase domain protein [Leptospira weilii serovar Topaz str. LT2116]|uniref:Dimethylallyltranstransferase domain protein n=1 Tax=Leptospira weilii serovar Topaz str. LT2116 TaxID=1088540 RepID=M3GWW1_9LEPT|nr:dimethylallyltranstransferase domain protein [Leptospira weilii serovar Topaz str. LT2116]